MHTDRSSMSRVPFFDADVLKHFESLGDNCEFGLVQVALGVDQLGFFRFNNSNFGALLTVLENGFKDFDDPQGVELEVACNNELIVFVPRYGFRYHTFQQAGEADHDKLLAQQKLALRWLARKAVDDLCAGEKLFIRKDSGEIESSDISRLSRALQAYGANRLLLVTSSDDRDKVGRVEPVGAPGQGIFVGCIDVFSRYQDARTFSYSWFDLCRAALREAKGWPVAGFADRDDSVGGREFVLHSLRDSDRGIGSGINVEVSWKDGLVLEDALVHGPDGVITVGKAVIEESLPASCLRQIRLKPGTGSRMVTLPEYSCRARVPAAYHLFGQCETDIQKRYQEAGLKRFTAHVKTRTAVILLIPEREDFVILEALRKLVPMRMPRLSVPRGVSVSVQHLFLPRV